MLWWEESRNCRRGVVYEVSFAHYYYCHREIDEEITNFATHLTCTPDTRRLRDAVLEEPWIESEALVQEPFYGYIELFCYECFVC